MRREIIILFGVMGILLISGCTQNQPQTKVCEGSGVVVNITDDCPEYWCGDGTCLLGTYGGYSEDCESCPQDCGQCPPEKMSYFDVISMTCDSVLPELRFTIKNTRREALTIREVEIRKSSSGMPSPMMQYSNYIIESGGTKTYTFPMSCKKGDSFSLQIKYTDSEGSHVDIGTRYQLE